jgi:hypothetical protein
MKLQLRMALMVCVGLLLLGGQVARADTLFTFSFVTPTLDYEGSGTLTAVDLGSGAFGVEDGTLTMTTGPTGTYQLYTANSYTPTSDFLSPSGAFQYDNMFYPTFNPELDIWGLLFTGNGMEINIWGNSSYTFDTYAAGSYGTMDNFSEFVTAEVPEPATLSLVGLGLIGIAGAVRRRK